MPNRLVEFDRFEDVCGVYVIKFEGTDLFYIGSSKDIRKRVMLHRRELRRNKHCNSYLQRIFNKYPDKIIFELLSECPREERVYLEQYYIDEFRPKLNLAKFAEAPYRMGNYTKEDIVDIFNMYTDIYTPMGDILKKYSTSNFTITDIVNRKRYEHVRINENIIADAQQICRNGEKRMHLTKKGRKRQYIRSMEIINALLLKGPKQTLTQFLNEHSISLSEYYNIIKNLQKYNIPAKKLKIILTNISNKGKRYKIDNKDVGLIKMGLSLGKNPKQIAKTFGISSNTINRIINKKYYGNVEPAGDITSYQWGDYINPIANKVSLEDIGKIKWLSSKEMSPKLILKKFPKIHYNTIIDIKKNRVYKELKPIPCEKLFVTNDDVRIGRLKTIQSYLDKGVEINDIYKYEDGESKTSTIQFFRKWKHLLDHSEVNKS